MAPLVLLTAMPRRGLARPGGDGGGLGGIIERRAGAVGVEVVDLVRFQPGFVAGHAHALQRGQSGGVRLGQVMAIGGDAIAGQRGEDFRAAGHRMGAALQHEHRRPLAQGQARRDGRQTAWAACG